MGPPSRARTVSSGARNGAQISGGRLPAVASRHESDNPPRRRPPLPPPGMAWRRSHALKYGSSSMPDELLVAVVEICRKEEQPWWVVRRDRFNGHHQLHADYFANDAVYGDDVFRRRFRMTKAMFIDICHSVARRNHYFQRTCNAAGVPGFTTIQKVKGLTKEEIGTCSDLVAALPDRIQSIPDGSSTAKKNGAWGASGSRTGGAIKFDSTADGNFDNEYFKGTEESNQFRQEYEMRKMKQDEGLDVIGEGLETLKNMASDMNEELDRQVPLMDEMDDKVDRANADLKNTNVRLKETVLQMRSSRNFCVDIILLCIILGIAAYLYNVLKK